ncbi:unnamed protein product [Pedinophyceae sp. YPF-701]|nr:unnamed protein product [Pedinophyceae sp. YPF-701]
MAGLAAPAAVGRAGATAGSLRGLLQFSSGSGTEAEDANVVAAFWVYGAIGIFCILVFIMIHRHFKVYTVRLHHPDVMFRPPKMGRFGAIATGISGAFAWLYPVIHATDEQILETAGMDALMHVRMLLMCIHLLLPATVVAIIVLLPIHITGNGVEEAQGDANVSQFMRLTASNVSEGSGLYWIHAACMYGFIAYACWLLPKHFRSFTALRHAHFMHGDRWEKTLGAGGKESNVSKRRLKDWQLHPMLQLVRPDLIGARRKPRILENDEVAQAGLSLIAFLSRARYARKQAVEAVTGPVSVPGHSVSKDAIRRFAAAFTTKRGAKGHKRGKSLVPFEQGLLAVQQGMTAPSDGRGAKSFTPERKSGLGRRGHTRHQSYVVERSAESESAKSLAVNMIINPGAIDVGELARPVGMGLDGYSMHGSDMASVAGDKPLDASRVGASAGVGHTPQLDEEKVVASFAENGTPREERVGTEAGASSAQEARTEPAVSKQSNEDAGVGAMRELGLAASSPAPRREGAPHLTIPADQGMTDTPPDASEAGGLLSPSDVQRWQRGAVQLDVPGFRASNFEEKKLGFWGFKKQPNQVQQDQAELEGRPARPLWRIPSVRQMSVFALPGSDANGNDILVRAMHYAVLVTDVPDIPSKDVLRTAAWGKKVGKNFASRAHRIERRASGGVPTTKPDAGDVEEGRSGAANGVDAQDVKPRLTGDGESPRVTPRAVSESGWSMDGSVSELGPSDPAELAFRRALQLGYDKTVIADSGDMVHRVFSELFPQEYVCTVPVRCHQQVDEMLMEWDRTCGQLDRVIARKRLMGRHDAVITGRGGCATCGCQPGRCLPKEDPDEACCSCAAGEVHDDAEQFYRQRLRAIEGEIRKAKHEALTSKPTQARFVIFRNQQAATMASQAVMHHEDGRLMTMQPAPSPEDVNWQSLWATPRQRYWRWLLTRPLLFLLAAAPVGLVAGAAAELDTAVCSDPGNWAYVPGYCSSQDSMLRNVFTAVVPALLVVLYQSWILPNTVYYLTMIQCTSVSLSGVDRRILSFNFYWGIFNVFVGGLLGSTILQQVERLVEDPGRIVTLAGTALPASSNFFLSFIAMRSLLLVPLSLPLPVMGLIGYFFCGCGRPVFWGWCGPLTARDRQRKEKPRTCRYGWQLGIHLLVLLVACVYAIPSPIVLPFCLLYFVLKWMITRYHVLYYYLRAYESGGAYWPYLMSRVMIIMGVAIGFLSAVLVTSRAYIPAALLWPLVAVLYNRHRQIARRVGHSAQHMPLATASAAPPALIDPQLYLPPPLRAGARGWHPESGKAWLGYNRPKFTY